MKTLQVPLTKETIEIVNNFFENNGDGTYTYSEEKQRDFIRKFKNPDGTSPYDRYFNT